MADLREAAAEVLTILRGPGYKPDPDRWGSPGERALDRLQAALDSTQPPGEITVSLRRGETFALLELVDTEVEQPHADAVYSALASRLRAALHQETTP